ncbi:Protein of unknown function, partial [Gryllus bimaculatus]
FGALFKIAQGTDRPVCTPIQLKNPKRKGRAARDGCQSRQPRLPAASAVPRAPRAAAAAAAAAAGQRWAVGGGGGGGGGGASLPSYVTSSAGSGVGGGGGAAGGERQCFASVRQVRSGAGTSESGGGEEREGEEVGRLRRTNRWRRRDSSETRPSSQPLDYIAGEDSVRASGDDRRSA